MNNDLKHFGQLLTQRFKGAKFELKQVTSLDEKLPSIHLFIFKNYPDTGLVTIVTHGLSKATHPKWHFGRPELILSVESEKEEWATALATVVNEFRGEKSFANGSVYSLEKPFCYESGMTGFVMYVPSFLNQEEAIFELAGNKTIFLTQAYPIYPGEAGIILKQGFESFWGHEKFQDPYDVKRDNISEH